MCAFDQVGPSEDLEMRGGDEEEAVPQTVLDDAPGLPNQTEGIEASKCFCIRVG
jgi:hypothetical protein